MYKNILFFVVVGLILSGCVARPIPFDPQNRAIVFKDGKPYRVPYATYYGIHFTSQYAASHYDCEYDDVLWVSSDDSDREKAKKDSLIHTNFIAWVLLMKKENKAGCVSPLSDREYEYYTNRESQTRQYEHAQRIQSQQNFNESLNRLNDTINTITPKTYNLNIR